MRVRIHVTNAAIILVLCMYMLVEQCALMHMICGNDQDVRLLEHVR